MKLLKVSLFSFFIAAAMVSSLFAQVNPEPEKKGIDTSIKISGVIYTEYAYFTGLQPGSTFNTVPVQPDNDGISSNKNSTFRINRVYLNFKKVDLPRFCGH